MEDPDVSAAYLLFFLHGWEPSKYYDMGPGQKTVVRAFLRKEVDDRKER